MNSVMERWIGSCRRELLDRTLVWNQWHLMTALRAYEDFYNTHRPHRALKQAAPLRRLPVLLTPGGWPRCTGKTKPVAGLPGETSGDNDPNPAEDRDPASIGRPQPCSPALAWCHRGQRPGRIWTDDSSAAVARGDSAGGRT